MKRYLIYVTIAAVVGLMALPALAGKGGGKGGGKGDTSSLVASSIVVNQASPRVGDTVTFTTTHGAIEDVGRIAILCWQQGALVYQWAGTEGETYTLWTTKWSGGATCSVDLFYYEYRGQTQVGKVVLASTRFDVAA